MRVYFPWINLLSCVIVLGFALAVNFAGESPPRADAIVAGFNLISEGLVARVADRDALREVRLDTIEGPCARRDNLRNPQEQVIWAEYRVAMLNRAQYLRRHGRSDEAEAYDRRAAELALEPSKIR